MNKEKLLKDNSIYTILIFAITMIFIRLKMYYGNEIPNKFILVLITFTIIFTIIFILKIKLNKKISTEKPKD